LEDLQRELKEYETLRSGKRKVVTLGSLEELPKTLIQARIAAGLSQEDLAAKLGLKP
jgi:ribosome-binding protein aMBF1 (putative translation factor)